MKQLSQIYFVMLLITTLSGCTTLGYYSQAVSGHLSLMMSTQSVSGLIDAPSTPPALKQKLLVANEARQFAAHRLALPVGDAFSEYAELGRPWVVVNLVAVPEFSLQAHRWCYPVVGCQAYRGYYELENARDEQQLFIADNYDTFIGGVTAYSTLGWFDDPLHTGFTSLSDHRMVALMFHELAHRVVYISDDTAFNESFATAVELEGLRLWLEMTEGDDSGFRKALARLRQRNQTLALVEDVSRQLEALYAQQDSLPKTELRHQKAQLFQSLQDEYQTLSSNLGTARSLWREPDRAEQRQPRPVQPVQPACTRFPTTDSGTMLATSAISTTRWRPWQLSPGTFASAGYPIWDNAFTKTFELRWVL